MIRDRTLHDWARPGEASEAELRRVKELLPFGALIAFSRAMAASPPTRIHGDDPISGSGFSPTDFGDSRNVGGRATLPKA